MLIFVIIVKVIYYFIGVGLVLFYDVVDGKWVLNDIFSEPLDKPLGVIEMQPGRNWRIL
jgi:hypothetical protein